MSGKRYEHIKMTENNKYPTLKVKRDPKSLHHYLKGEIKILTPAEYRKLRVSIPKDRHKTLLDVLFITGIRYVEVQRLWNHKE